MYYTYFFCLDTSQQNDCVELKFCQIIDTVRETASVRANFLSILQEKPIFSILHIHFYKTLTLVCLIYYLFYLNNHISLIFIISNKQIPTWPHPYFSFFFSCQPSFFFSEPSQGSFSAFPSSFYSLFFFLFFFFFFFYRFLKLNGWGWGKGYFVVLLWEEVRGEEQDERGIEKKSISYWREEDNDLLHKHWSLPQVLIHRSSRPKNADLHHCSTNPLSLTHKRYLRRRRWSISYLFVCSCGCVCVFCVGLSLWVCWSITKEQEYKGEKKSPSSF